MKNFLKTHWACVVVVVVLLIALTLSVTGTLEQATQLVMRCLKWVLCHIIDIATLLCAIWAVHVADKINEGTFMGAMAGKYGDDKMCKAIRTLIKFKLRSDPAVWSSKAGLPYPTFGTIRTSVGNRKDFVPCTNHAVYHTGATITLPWTEEEDKARRYFKHYFFEALRQKELGRLSEKAILSICRNSSIGILFNIVEPMEEILNSGYDSKPFYELMRIASKDKVLKGKLSREASYDEVFFDTIKGTSAPAPTPTPTPPTP